MTESSGRWNAAAVELVAETDGDEFTLQGEKCFVVDGHTAGKIVVVARLEGSEGDDGISFFVVDGDAPGLTKSLLKTVDPTRKLARLEFNSVQAEPLGEPGAGMGALTKTLDQAAIALSNEMIGGAQYLMDSTVEYSKVRMQFGRVIGSFQAIKHRCADMLLLLELAKSAAYRAAAALDEGDESVPVLANMAKSAASDAYIQIAADSIQIHGGIGFTWDQDTHLWFKRAKSSEVFLGDPAYHRELMMQRWGEGI